MLKTRQYYDFLGVPLNSIVRFTKTGEIAEIVYLSVTPKGSPTTKVSKDLYRNNYTDEICEYKHTFNRSEDFKSFNRSLANAQKMINLNIKNLLYCRWVTLTYSENMRDSKRLYNEVKIFIKSARRKYGHFGYITAAEPQERGAWHVHIILIFNCDAPFMHIDVLSSYWKYGNVTIKSIDNIYDLSLYLTAYIGDMPLDEYVGPVDKRKIKTVFEDGKPKQYVKRGRMHLYPAGFNIFRYSRGLKKPVKEYMTNEKAHKRLGDSVLIFKKTIELSDDKYNFKAFLIREIYMSKKSHTRYVAHKLEQNALYKEIQYSDYDEQS